jgi:hypothetical protein
MLAHRYETTVAAPTRPTPALKVEAKKDTASAVGTFNEYNRSRSGAFAPSLATPNFTPNTAAEWSQYIFVPPDVSAAYLPWDVSLAHLPRSVSEAWAPKVKVFDFGTRLEELIKETKSQMHEEIALFNSYFLRQPNSDYVSDSSPNIQSISGALKDVSKATQADKVVSQLIRFRNYSANWDGHGAAKPDINSLEFASRFIRKLAPESIIPRAALHADGLAILFWNTPDKYAELEFMENGRINYYARIGELEWSDDFGDNEPLPQGLLNIGFVRT